MKQQFQRDNPDVFDLAWLDDEELAALQRKLADGENEICAYWLRSLNEQAAIRTGKLRIIPGTEARDLDFKQYSVSELDAARSIFGSIENQLNGMGKSTAERFCELLVRCCSEAIERKQEYSSPNR
jgi:hypothetical protein